MRAGLSIAFTILFIVGSLDAGGTSQWSEGPSDFPAGTALNINSSGGDVRLDRNLAHPANWTQMAARTEAPAHRTGHVMASKPKCSKNSWLDIPARYLSRKYCMRWWVVTGRRSGLPR